MLIADLVFLYLPNSNSPLYLNRYNAFEPVKHEIRLEVTKNLSEDFFFQLSPYVLGNEADPVGRTGLEARIGFRLGQFTVSYYHHSSHDADFKNDEALGIDGVEVRWRLN